ncbi:MAG: hypothetical protein ACKV2Q_35515 [Planctomycetaceae bacterium]
MPATVEMDLVVEQRMKTNRRVNDRRRQPLPVPPDGVERRTGEVRRKAERRREIDPTTCERDYSLDEVEFMNAMDTYKRRSGRPFPTWSEVLEVVRSLGYRKTEAPNEIIIKSR